MSGSQATFGTDLLTRTGSEALLRLNDEELRQLESMRVYFAKRSKIDAEYAQSLAKLRDRAPLARTDAPGEEPNPIVKVRTDNFFFNRWKHATFLMNALALQYRVLCKVKQLVCFAKTTSRFRRC